MRPWDELVHVNSAPLTCPALTRSPRQEAGQWSRQTSPIEYEARGTASSATLLSSDLFRKDFLCSATAGAAVQHCPTRLRFPPHPLMISSNSSKVVGDRAVEAAALAELRRAHTNPAAVAQFVDRVENVDNIETDFDGSLLRDLDPALQTNVERFVGMILHRVGKTAPQSIAVKSIDGRSPIVPRIGDPGGTGEALIVVEEDPVLFDVGELIRIE